MEYLSLNEDEKSIYEKSVSYYEGKNEVMVLEKKENITPRKEPGIRMEPEDHMQTASWGNNKGKIKCQREYTFL